jgi:hypothetical protein
MYGVGVAHLHVSFSLWLSGVHVVKVFAGNMFVASGTEIRTKSNRKCQKPEETPETPENPKS